MAGTLVPRSDARLSFCGQPFPKIISDAGHDAMRRFAEFFTANIRNKNTREVLRACCCAILSLV